MNFETFRKAAFVVVFIAVLAMAVQAITYDIPKQMETKRCVEWAMANPGMTAYLASIIEANRTGWLPWKINITQDLNGTDDIVLHS